MIRVAAMNDHPSIPERLVQGLLAPRHTLPQFLILGAQRSGTTTLYKWIMQHPQILPGTEKEIHFFDRNFQNGVSWYRLHFPTRRKLGSDRITGEATPYYLFHPRAPERIRRVLPDVKMIALLRNPVERAVSHYFHEVHVGREDQPIEEALRIEESRLQPELEKMQKDESYFSEIHHRKSYKTRGLYAEQLKRYFDLFERRQLLVLSSEEYFADPAKALHFCPTNSPPRKLRGATRPFPIRCTSICRITLNRTTKFCSSSSAETWVGMRGSLGLSERPPPDYSTAHS
jgi:hypothetical protein